MTKRKAFLIVQAILCALVAVFLAAGALTMYFDGAEKQAQGEAVSIYTREKVSAKLLPVLPLMCLSIGVTLAGLLLGVRDESQDKPMRDENLIRGLGNLRDRAVHQAASPRERYIRTAVMALAAALIAAGILNGGLADVLAKGAAICAECIGLG